jgi:transcription-repair coupling factor (superfamily II helicase)
LRTTALGITRNEAGPKGARVEFSETPNVDPAHIIKLLQTESRRYRLDGPNRLRITVELPDAAARLAAIATLIDGLR